MEMLVKAISATNPDPEKDRRGTHKKGDICAIMPDNHPWGAKEGLPLFVIVRCPEVTVAQVQNRIEPWVADIRFEVLNSNLPIDGHRIRMTNANAGASGAAGVTLAQVQAFLTAWGAAFVSASAGTVTFDVSIATAALSRGLWNRDISVLNPTETAYVQAGGLHTFTLDLTLHPRWTDEILTPEGLAAQRAQVVSSVQSEVQGVGGTWVGETNGLATFTITRAIVRERFRADVTQKLGTFKRHRYHFTEAQVDTVIAAGGSITVTAAQLASAVRDALTEA
jgi:hypothetical protein